MQRLFLWIVAVLAFFASAAQAESASSHPTPSPSVAPTATLSPSPAPTETPLPSPMATATPSPEHTHSLPVDGAFSLPGGIWNCETLANSSATSVYHLIDAHHIAERTMLALPNRPPVELLTSFSFDPKHNMWSLIMQKGAYEASAAPWANPVWIFEGLELDQDPHRAVRLVYTSLGPDAYRSDYQAQSHGTWATFSGATCKRSLP